MCNQLVTIHPQALENCTKLEGLHLRHNRIASVDFLHRIRSSAFRHLNLRSNAIDYFNASYHLQGLMMIRRLYLHDNQLSDESFTFSSNDNLTLSRLVRIDLSDNQFKIMPQFEVAQHLKEIYLDQNYLTSFPSNSSLGLVKELAKLTLGSNAIRHVPSSSMWGPFDAMKSLDLRSNDLQSIDEEAILAVPNIEYLIVTGSGELNLLPNFTPVGMSLRFLVADSCGLTDMPAVHLREMRVLEELNLDFNRLRYFPTEVLVMVKQLQILSLRHNYLISFQDPTENGPLPQTDLVILLPMNPFVCDRHICWLLNNRNANISFDQTSILCDQPETYRLRSLSDLQGTTICQGKWSNLHWN